MSKPYRLAQGRPPRRPREESLLLLRRQDASRLPGRHASPPPSWPRASASSAAASSITARAVSIGLGSEEMNALIGVGEGARHEPNLRATQVELFNGLSAVSQNRWPSLNWDIGAINNQASRFIPGGFYYKTFMWPASFWKHVYEPFIRRAAGLGKAPEGRDPDTYEQIHVHCDVLVIGGGVAGLAAAEAAAANRAPRSSSRTRTRAWAARRHLRRHHRWPCAARLGRGQGRETARRRKRPCAEPHDRRRPLAPQLPHAVRARGGS